MMVMKNKSLTTSMSPYEKPKARRRNPERENIERMPRVLSSTREDPSRETFRRKDLPESTQEPRVKNTGTSADALGISTPGSRKVEERPERCIASTGHHRGKRLTRTSERLPNSEWNSPPRYGYVTQRTSNAGRNFPRVGK
jgi:hypothetical protein